MTEPITFAQLQGVLEQLGFCKSVGPKDHVIYRHAASDTLLYYPPQHTNDLVPMASIVGTRKLLVDRGVVDAEQLEQLFHAVAY